MLTKKNFKCKRCGQCCSPYVILSEKDIKKIEELGHKREDFITESYFKPNAKIIRQINGNCMFLAFSDGGEASCKIYSNRPEICRRYPFISLDKLSDCKPDNRFTKSVADAREWLKKRGML
jgi:Fe-S-cluster containining protein